MMSSSKINVHYEDISFKLPAAAKIKHWLTEVAQTEGYALKELNYVFCSDTYLLQINKEHLNHDYLTDIITFDNSEASLLLEADIFISVDRVKENAIIFKQEFMTELKRVMVHGLLHLMGYKDKSAKDKAIMREKEDTYLSI